MLEHDLVQDAQNFASSEAVKELLNRLEAKYIEDWKATVPIGTETREFCFHMVKAIQALREEINNVAKSQKIAEWNRRLNGRPI